MKWLRNTWRPPKKPNSMDHKNLKMTDYLWHTKREEVLNEIAVLMGLEHVDTNTPGWFAFRTRATKRIIEGMTEVEKSKLRGEVDDMARKGFPKELQQK